MGASRRLVTSLGLALVAGGLGVPAAAQFSDGYSFLKAVRDRDGAKATEYLDKPGHPALETHDPSTGETALHIVVRRHDQTWLAFLLGRGAQIDARDRGGNTPLLVAAQTGDPAAVQLLLQAGAGVNTANDQGETPLIYAVQRRDLEMARQLVAAGADPKRRDNLSGKSAADYAAEDRRASAIAKVLTDAHPKALPANVSGPTR